MTTNPTKYYVPHSANWPIWGSIGLTTQFVGAALWVNGHALGPKLAFAGLGIILLMMFGWFTSVVCESERGAYNEQVDGSFRMAMIWFIFSEVMFFGVFFGALFYVRMFALPDLAGESFTQPTDITHQFLWPDFKNIWPLLTNPNPGVYAGPKAVIETWGIPALNTLILLTSGATLTWAHWGLEKGNRGQLVLGMWLTVALGAVFLYFQVHEYGEAYNELGLTLSSGIYGTTFFMLTGFHGLHVTIGTIMLIVISFRCMRGHFNKDRHFAFKAVAWYWHFVDVVWLLLFVLVYWL